MALTERIRQHFIEHEGCPEHPYVPRDKEGRVVGDSGITIGLGEDLGQIDGPTFAARWRQEQSGLKDVYVFRLATVCGLRKAEAVKALPRVIDIRIPKTVALNMFLAESWPRWYQATAMALPGLEQLPADAQGALVSLCYNRGTRVPEYDEEHPESWRREEMAGIKTAVAEGNLPLVAKYLCVMARLWDQAGHPVPGLVKRRYAEARLVWPEIDCAAVRTAAGA